MDRLLVITTGGTIDKIYFDDKSDYQVGDPQISETLNAMNVAFDFDVIPLMRKDSLHIDGEDRALIAETIADSDATHILITHGTDSMVDTALSLEGLRGRRIVLTGALHPARFRDSDAVFNIGCALGAVQCVEPGVWVAMNGRIWNPRRVTKNVDANRFEAQDD
ncbi:asparaginase [Marinihelvus fidelis]|uniref:Asparaginase n=2 Tax=Marinihelvus fidelis TaxID=2613842 RepID=A0A5N0T8T2_9GAMM|nr:asparaginase [Marinihelvus fidelis]